MNKISESAGIMGRRAGSVLAYTLFTAIASAMTTTSHAQTFAEWFKQKSTQKKYLLQQIAALEVYAGYVKTGYHIAGQGLGSVSVYLGSEHDLHAAYYQNQKTVNLWVRENPQLNEILAWRAAIVKKLTGMVTSTKLARDERQHLNQVRNAVLTDCNVQMNRLENMITDGRLEMNDAERLKQLATIHQAMKENYLFANDFAKQVAIYCGQRHAELHNISTYRQLYVPH